MTWDSPRAIQFVQRTAPALKKIQEIAMTRKLLVGAGKMAIKVAFISHANCLRFAIRCDPIVDCM